MFVSNKNCDFEKNIFVIKKDNIKIIQNYSTIIIKNTVQMPGPFLLTNEEMKKQKSVYVLNKKFYNIKSFINKVTCYVGNNNESILKLLKMNTNYMGSLTYVHKKINNKLIIKNNDIIIKYHAPYSGDVFKINKEEINIEGKIKDFRIVAQKYSYIEYYMGLGKNTIKDVRGLPQGMLFDKNCLKGTPIISGDFFISIKLNNGTIVSGILKVSRLPRQL